MTEPVTQIPLDKLLLDPLNPRLPTSVDRDQQSILDYIALTTSIEELMEAIAQNGFFPGEPLIVTREGAQFVVVEGNRRLTALRLLQDPSACSRPGERMRSISLQAKHRPDVIPAIVCAKREDVLPYLGFRHITGVKQWEPLAKARYIEQLFRLTDASLEPRERYTEVARTIGSRRDHIRRNLDALAVYEVIKESDFYGINGLNDESLKFSVLSTAVADERIGRFVGTNAELDGMAAPTNPIIDSRVLNNETIKELTNWLFAQDSKGKTRIGESRNLRFLSAVVGNGRALQAFRSGSPIKIAYQLTSDLAADFTGLLYQADGMLAEAASMVATVAYEDESYRVAKRILDNIKLIGRALKDKNRQDEDEF